MKSKTFILLIIILLSIALVACTPDGQLFLEGKKVDEDVLTLTFDARLKESIDLKIELIPHDNAKSTITYEHLFRNGNYTEDVTLRNLEVNTRYFIKFSQITGKYLSNFGVIDNVVRVYPYASEISTELQNEYMSIVDSFYKSNNFKYKYVFDLKFVENKKVYTHSETIEMDYYNGLTTYSKFTKNSNSNVSIIYTYSEKNGSGYDLYFNQNNQGWRYVFEAENNLDNIQNQVDLDLRHVIGIEKSVSNDKIYYDVILEYQGYQSLYDNIVRFFDGIMIDLEGNETLLVHIEVKNGKIVLIKFDVSIIIEPFLDANFDLNLSYYTYSIEFTNYNLVNPIIIPKEVK
jgi:hypothetical protein